MEETEHFDSITRASWLMADIILMILGSMVVITDNNGTTTYVRMKSQHFHAIDCMFWLPRLVLFDHQYKPNQNRITSSEVKNCR
jgi:hypothetical protein